MRRNVSDCDVSRCRTRISKDEVERSFPNRSRLIHPLKVRRFLRKGALRFERDIENLQRFPGQERWDQIGCVSLS